MYSIDQIIDVRIKSQEMGMSVTEISQKTGISRPTIYGFLKMEDFNITQVRGHRGKVVDLQEIRKGAQEAPSADTALPDVPEAGNVEAQAAPSASEEADDGEEAATVLELIMSRNRPSKVDPFKAFVIASLQADRKENPKQRLTNTRLLELAREQGYDGGHTIFFAFCRQARDALKIHRKKRAPEGYIPLWHAAGEAQADFGKARFEEDGLSYEGSYFVLSFPFSNAGYLQLHFGENLECLLESMKAIFEYLGGVPHEIWFDNATAIVTKILDGGDRHVTDKFRRFKEHYRFKAVFMNPESGWEKGNVERKVSYLRNNVLAPAPKFAVLSDFNGEEAFKKCEKIIQEDEHYMKKVPVRTLFAEDKEALLPLPSIPFDTASYEIVHTDKWALFKLGDGKHIYSSAPDHNDSDLLVQVTAAHVAVMDMDGRHIVTHPRLYGGEKDRMERIDYVPYLKFIARKPRSFFNVPIREMMPQKLVSYLDSLPNGDRGKLLSELAVISEEEGFGQAVDAIYGRLEGTLARGRETAPGNPGQAERLDIPYALARDPADKENNE